MAGRLQDKVAIVTGTGSGIGRAAAEKFASEGARVVGCDIDADNAEKTRRSVTAAGGEMASLHPVDLSAAEGAERLVAFALEAFGGIDIVFNNAAMAYFDWVPDMTHETFAATMREEVDIVFHLVRAAWPHLVARGGGAIVSTASGAAKMALPEQGGLAHCAAKGAVLAMTRQYAAEGGAHGIRVNTVSPGLVRTAQTASFLADDDWSEKLHAKRIIKRPGEPAEIAAAAAFLASDEASYITGADLAVDGGSTAV